MVLVLGGLLYAYLFGIFIWKLYVLLDLMRSLYDESNNVGLEIVYPGSVHTLFPLGNVMFKMSRIIVLFLYLPVNFTIYALFWQPDVSSMFLTRAVLQFFIFIILSLCIIIYPLVPTHLYMRTQKYERINEVTKRYKKIGLRIFNGKTSFLPVDEDVRNEFLYVKALYTDVLNMQEWPFEHNFLSESFKSLALPLSIWIFESLLGQYIFSILRA